MRLFRRIAVVAIAAALVTTVAADPSVTDTRMLTQPAVSATHIAFVYANDLWVANRDGSNVRRLTSDDGVESNPAFSPDGKWIAFSAQYEGNTDVYLLPVEGGVPKRLTWHPSADIVQDFTPDGKAVLFTSNRAAFNNRYSQLYTVPVGGGMETMLPIPNAAQARYTGDGKSIAYNPLRPAFLQWKHYRGGLTSEIWVFDPVTNEIYKVPQPPSHSNDVDAMWLNGKIFFRSDRNGELNLFSYDRQTKQVQQLTNFTDFPVLRASAGGGVVVFEQAGYLWLLDPARPQPTRLHIGAVSDLRELRPRFASGAKWINSMDISPSGARAVFDFRGDIVTVPAEKGDARNLTNSLGASDRTPSWSPDGGTIAFISDEGGEYSLRLTPQDGKGATKTWPIAGGAGFYDHVSWSPDSTKIALIDNAGTIFIVDAATGAVTKAVEDPNGGGSTNIAWSPDSKWLAYTMFMRPVQMMLSLYSLDQKKSFPVTDGLAAVFEPVFDKSGKYLYVFGSTDAGPVIDGFALSSLDMRLSAEPYVIVLSKDESSPLAKESDEEKKQSKESKGSKESGESAESKKPDAPATTRIDLDGIQYRILDLPVPAGQLSGLQAGETGHIYFLRKDGDRSSLQHFDLSKRKVETALDGVAGFVISDDGKKILYGAQPESPDEPIDSFFITAASGKIEPGQGRLNIEAVQVRVDPRVEWPAIFDEAWRVSRDFFYAPNMHGVDWPAMKKKYAAFLPELSTRSDLNRVLQWLGSELVVGHNYITNPGDYPFSAKPVPGGLLGADYDVANGRYRFKKVYGGLNFNPKLRSPLTEPGVNVRAGEYLIAVRGQDLRPPASVYSLFENTAGKSIEITVGPNADGSGSRTVTVVPISNEAAIRNRDWIEGNIKKVDAATGGRVAYVYVPDTAQDGHDYFKRYFFPQAYKDAVIIDERFNSGGLAADYVIDILKRSYISDWAGRAGANSIDQKLPMGSIQGPKVMIIDETAGSGGDLLPWMFRKAKLGTIVGKRTWGGLVGIGGYPALIDGGTVTAPNFAIWTRDEGWVVENQGVAPDIEVEQSPTDVIAGRDPQLERAIAVALEQLKQNPPKPAARPPYPVKVGGTGRGGGGGK